MLNIVILHHFDYPEGMATTKRFQLFADYFIKEGCKVSFVLKSHKVGNSYIEKGFHRGAYYFKVFFSKQRKYPFYYDKIQNRAIVELLNTLYDSDCRNIILTGGITPEFLFVIRRVIPKWNLFCDYVEDYTTIGSIYNELNGGCFFCFLKSKIASGIYAPLELFAERFMFRRANGISAISPYLYTKAKMHSKNAISIPITANRLIINEKNKSNNTITLFFAGSGSLKDGLDTLALAYSKVSKRYDIRLQISGKISSDGLNLIKRNCNDIDNIHLLGFLNDSEYYRALANADIMLMTRNNSKFANAGFPFKLGEYLATGKPVITTRVAGIDQYLEHGKSAIFIEPGDENALENAISFLIENREIAKNIGIEGQRVFEEHFLAENNCKKFYDFICSDNISQM